MVVMITEAANMEAVAAGIDKKAGVVEWGRTEWI